MIRVRLLALASIGWLISACGAGAGSGQSPTQTPANQPATSPDSPSSSNTPGAHPTYLGGPLVRHAKVVAVYWNGTVNYQSELESFYRVITASAYFASLEEYSTDNPQQTIGLGTLLATAIDRGSPTGNQLHNEDIQRELSRLIANGAVPKNDPDTVYMIHMPSGVSVEFEQGFSCRDFCAYHSTFQRNRASIYYAVVPDMGGACSNACGPSNQLGNTTAVASHELAEAVTDPEIGLAAEFGPPLGWYDQQAGEIADICNGQRSTVAGFTVQPLWSNALNRCRLF